MKPAPTGLTGECQPRWRFTDALRVYSEDMRHKRLSRAEEKAYALPAKLALPMMACIFPVIFVVILLPVVVRLYNHAY